MSVVLYYINTKYPILSQYPLGNYTHPRISAMILFSYNNLFSLPLLTWLHF